MYGLIIENVLGYLRSHFHPKRYEEVKKVAKFPYDEIDIDRVYPDGLIPKLVKKGAQVLQITENEILEGVGVYFVTITKHLGLRKTIVSIAREFREFIMNLDNAHDYFKLRFTKLRAPSFFVDQEHENGLVLHYRSRRRGFAYYVLGQMKEIARVVYKKDLQIKLKKQEVVFDTVIVTYSLEFDNTAYVEHQRNAALRQEASLPIRAHIIFEIFPFSILFTDDLTVSLVGGALRMIMPGVIGQPLNQCFNLVRPLVEFNSEQILQRTNNVWVLKALLAPSKVKKIRKIELVTDQHHDEKPKEAPINGSDGEAPDEIKEEDDALQLRGIMMYMPMWKKILFIGCPIIDNLSVLVKNGLFINDLSMHDYSRDILINHSQHQMEEKMTKQLLKDHASEIEDINTRHNIILASNMKTAGQWVPPQIALAEGPPDHQPPINKVDFIVLLYAKVDRLTYMSTRADPVELIDLLDDLLRVFDHLVETIGDFKVETLTDYMACSDFTAGFSETTQAERVATLALDLQNAVSVVFREPLARSRVLKLRIGVHFGSALAIVVGRKLPKFCLLGESVRDLCDIAEACPPGKIMCHEDLKSVLPPAFKFGSVSGTNSFVSIEKKMNHSPIPVAQILHAYAVFKHSRTKNGKTGAKKKRHDDDEIEDMDQLTVEITERRNSMCNGFVKNSTTCTMI